MMLDSSCAVPSQSMGWTGMKVQMIRAVHHASSLCFDCREKVFGPTSFFVTSIQPLSNLKMMNVKIVDLNTPSASSPDLIQSSVLVRPRASLLCILNPLCSLNTVGECKATSAYRLNSSLNRTISFQRVTSGYQRMKDTLQSLE